MDSSMAQLIVAGMVLTIIGIIVIVGIKYGGK